MLVVSIILDLGYTVQPRLSGLLGTTQMGPDNRGTEKYSLLLSPKQWDQPSVSG